MISVICGYQTCFLCMRPFLQCIRVSSGGAFIVALNGEIEVAMVHIQFCVFRMGLNESMGAKRSVVH